MLHSNTMISSTDDGRWPAITLDRLISGLAAYWKTGEHERPRDLRARDRQFVEVWHLEDIESLMRSLRLEPPKTMLRLAARRSGRQYRRGR